MRSLLLDTGLVVVLVIGNSQQQLNQQEWEWQNFTGEDYLFLLQVLETFPKLWITSFCLSEVSNLLLQTRHNQLYMHVLRELCRRAAVQIAQYPVEPIWNNDLVLQLGIPDVSILLKSRKVTCTLSTDRTLCQHIREQQRSAMLYEECKANPQRLENRGWKG